MQLMMRLAPITFPIAMLAGLGWCIGIAYSVLPVDIGGTRPLAGAKTHVLRDCQPRTQTGAYPACTPNVQLGL